MLGALTRRGEENARAIKDTGDTSFFGGPLLRSHEHGAQVRESSRALVQNTTVLAESALWRRFARGAAAGSTSVIDCGVRDRHQAP